MTDINFENDRHGQQRSRNRTGLGLLFSRIGGHVGHDLFRLSSAILVLLGLALLATGAICVGATNLPQWSGLVLTTAGMVILIFLTGRHS